MQKEFLSTVDFTDENLIRSSALSDKLFSYLVLSNRPGFTAEQRSNAYRSAVDKILDRSKENPPVDAFVKNYLIHGFEVLGMPELVRHIKTKG